MGLWDKVKGEFIDIIEWLDDSRDTIVWRFPRYQNEIKMGAKLIVRESQTAVFVNEGQVADVFTPGTYTLQTQNLPILSTLKGWKYGFDSPWKAEVYFVNTRQFTDFKWGTQNPVMMRDAEFGMVRLRAFGAYALRVVDPEKLLRELVGTDPQFRTEEVSEFIRQLIVGHLGPALATAQVPVLDLVAQQLLIGQKLAGVLTQELSGYGVQIPKFIIENISLPPEVEEALDKRTSMGVLGNLDAYTKFQAANAMEDAANNQGGAGEGFGLGLGMAAGQRMANALSQPAPAPAAPPAAPAGPPPLPQQDQWFAGINGQQAGPFDLNTLGAQVRSGAIGRGTLVWKNGMAQWTPAEQVPELGPLFAAVPPPFPPQG
ncbi:SPFH domain-containing protein [Dactylosporangium fulvum]|uniref:SPFH domain-containing protein n=1 Tax=Dactylosporangium fulvum TaxID=53359 RepID=A0ABY5VNS4_9ACTN|nr:SPFH domain-containing protein [Dactylosporangium fulvum]UWP79382.1 SPFH domain-containing protein [Dactylosporangium fulvum]